MPGRVILLNGTSSSGKTAVAAELLQLLPSPWFLMSIDAFNAMRSREQTARLTEEGLDAVLRSTRAGFHRAVAGMADAGNDVLVDYVLSEPWRLADLRRALGGTELVMIGVHCDEDELVRRERRREDRPVGLAVSQLAAVHAHGGYDIEVDTTDRSPSACAQLVLEALTDRWR